MADSLPSDSNRHFPVKVLVVEDSPSIREFLVYLLASDPEIRVIGTAANGEEALAAVASKRPDVVTMDIHMPKMNGFEATRKIMESCPTPIIIVTGSSSGDELATTFLALEAGALAVMKRPMGIGHPQHAATAMELIQTIKLMAEVKVVRRWAQRPKSIPAAVPAAMPYRPLPAAGIRLVAIGSSTGGPLVLQEILATLPGNFPVPIIVVQHIADGFTEGFAQWLTHSSGFPVSVATHNEFMQPGRAYVAPNGYQATVDRSGRIALQKDSPENGLCPSVSCLFRSVAAAYGPNAVGILLTGMGKDGAAELGLMRGKGAVTIAQDKESAVVHGMPGEAIGLGAAMYVLPPDKIAAALAGMARTS